MPLSATTLPEPFRGFLEHTSDAVVVADESGRILHVNLIAAALFGYAPEELLDKPVETLMPEVFRRAHARHRADYAKAPRLRPMGVGLQLRGRHRSGREIPVEINLRPATGPHGLLVAAVIRDLTALKALEAELEERERRLNAIFDHTYQFIGILEPDGVLLEANRSALAFVGVALSDVAGLPFWETPWWRDSPSSQAQLRAAIQRAAHGERVRFEAQHRDRRGHTAAIDFSLGPAADASGAVVYLVAEGQNITDRREIENALRRSEQRLALALHGSHDGIWDWDLAGKGDYVSPEARDLLGLREGEASDDVTAFFARVHADDDARLRAAIEGHLRAREVCDVDVRLRHENGTYRWCRVSGQALWDADGRPIRLVGSLTDVGAAKAREARLRGRLARAQDIGHTGSYERPSGAEGREWQSPEFLKLLGRDPRAGLLTEETYLDAVVHPDDREMVAEARRASARTGLALSLEYRVVTPDGSIRWLHDSGEVVQDPDSGTTTSVGTVRDVTESRDLEARLREQHVLARLGQMMATVAHEIRNPLAGVSGVLQVLQNQLPDGHVHRPLFAQMLSRLGDLTLLTNELLDYSRPRPLHQVESSLRDAVAEAALVVRDDPAFRGVTVRIEGPDVRLPLDVRQIVSVFQNLILNAAQAMNGAGVVTITIEPAADVCAVVVADRGPGIPADVLPRIFEPFFTTKHRGTGLGLAQTNKSIQDHRGTIAASNSSEGGASFRLTLPIA